MDYKLFSSVLFLFVLTVECQNLNNNENATSHLSVIEGTLRKGRAQADLAYVSLITCAVSSNPACLVDAAGKLFEIKKNELLAQADLDAFRATGRADPDSTPSHVAKTVEQLISQLSGLFRDTLSGFFSAKEGDDDDEVVDADDKDDGSSRGVSGAQGQSARKKKNGGIIRKIKNLVRGVLIGATIVAKICILLKFFHALLKLKFLLVAVGHLILSAVKLWVDAKQDNHPPKVVYYSQAQHDHHYDDEWLRQDWNRRLNNPGTYQDYS